MVNGPVHVYPIWKEDSTEQRAGADLDQSRLERNSSRLTEKSFKSRGIANALDSSEDDAVWKEENEETEDAKEIIDNEFETGSEGEEGE